MNRIILIFLILLINLYGDFIDYSDSVVFCNNTYYTTGTAWEYVMTNNFLLKKDTIPDLLMTNLEIGNPKREFYNNTEDGSVNLGPELKANKGLFSIEYGGGKNPIIANINHDKNYDFMYIIRGLIQIYYDLDIPNKIINSNNHIPKKYSSNLSTYAISDFDNDNYPDFVLGYKLQKPEVYLSSVKGFVNLDIPKDFDISGEIAKILVFDYNNDSFKDIYFICSNGQNLFFKNNGNGSFSKDLACDLGIDDPGDGHCGAIADINNDGFTDIIVGNYGISRLFINNNGEGFIDKTFEYNFIVTSYVNDIAIGDYDNDGFDDIYFACGKNQKSDENNRNIFIKNSGGSSFQRLDNITTQDIDYSTNADFIDYDKDGNLDLFIANYGKNKLFLNKSGNKNFIRIFFQPLNKNILSFTSIVKVRNQSGTFFKRIELSLNSQPVTSFLVGGITSDTEDYTIEIENPLLESPIEKTAKKGETIVIYNIY